MESQQQNKNTDNEFSYTSLEAIQKRLLDLSGRNRLLNFVFNKTNSVRFVENTLNNIYQALLNEQTINLVGIPTPTAEELMKSTKGYYLPNEKGEMVKVRDPSPKEWAQELQIPTDYTLPLEGEGKNSLRAIAYNDLLFAQLEKLRRTVLSIQAETGVNTLYLILGFLEYRESDSSDEKRLAPIYTIPVTINREQQKGHRKYTHYTLSIRDEPIQQNLTLQEKLQRDFGFVLPDLDEGENISHYFAELESFLKVVQKSWRLLPNLSLAILNFNKQVMYQDLDPSNWPEGESLDNHPIIAKFFEERGTEDYQNAGFRAEEYEIDKIKEVHERYPLVYDADSSQYSAVIDALSGENLIIEGPPGTGKSQTITNLIAAAISSGKKVLFIAEKMAALEVVYSRLEKVGLADFCLELHSNKTIKRDILEDLSSCYTNRGRAINNHLQDYIILRENARIDLQRYTEIINSEWKKTGLTIHTLFNRAVRYQIEVSKDINDLLKIEDDSFEFNGENFTRSERLKFEQKLERFKGVYKQVSLHNEQNEDYKHPWQGVGIVDLTANKQQTIIALLEEWNQRIDGVLFLLKEAHSVPIEQLKYEYQTLKSLPVIKNEDFYNLFPEIIEKTCEFETYHSQYKNIHRIFTKLGIYYVSQFLADRSNRVETLKTYQQSLMGLQPILTEPLNRYIEMSETVNELVTYLHEHTELITHWAAYFPSIISADFNLNIGQINLMKRYVTLLEELPAHLWKERNDIYLHKRTDEAIELLEKYYEEIKPYKTALESFYDLSLRPSYRDVKAAIDIIKNTGFFGKFTSKYRVAKKIIEDLAVTKLVRFKDLKYHLDQYLLFLEATDELESRGQGKPYFEQVYNGGIDTFENVFALRKWGKRIAEEFGTGFDNAGLLGKTLMHINEEDAGEIVTHYYQGVEFVFEKIIDFYHTSRALILEPDYRLREASPLLGNNSALIILKDYLQSSFKKTALIFNTTDIEVQHLNEHISKLEDLNQYEKSWSENIWTTILEDFSYRPSIELDNFNQYFSDEAEKLLQISSASTNIKVLFNLIKTKSYQEYRHFVEGLKEIKPLFLEEEVAAENFFNEIQSSSVLWNLSESLTFSDLKLRNIKALEHASLIYEWIAYTQEKRLLEKRGFSSFTEALDLGLLTINETISGILAAVYTYISNEILSENRLLSKFNGLTHNEVVNNFKQLDQQVIVEQSKAMSSQIARGKVPKGVSTGRVSNYTEYSLLSHEANKKSRHIPLREFLSRAKKTVSILKPCFMMSPMSVAQYLKPGEFKFDLVVMDEASQILPEDALGAIARGRSLVVVGDPKQLPPTSFFQTQNKLDEAEDYHSIEESESILDVVRPIFKNRQLRWHYRSQHESLIAFSNRYFYDSNLVLFPSPVGENEEFGIKYQKIAGVFRSGVNPIEAEKVAHILLEQVSHNPNETVGVVAMNVKQQQLIMDYVEKLKEDVPEEVRERLDDVSGLEPVFIKNLENVQGDERDVIIISMTYGPETAGGRVMQRFGPINSSVGWRRLNVLFTRSKKRMLVISSMGSSDILLSENSSQGVGALRNFLHYCESGNFHTANVTGRPADSDFEIAVSQVIEENGFMTVPQVGVAGYFIDLAVYHPKNPHHYLMGIECDGATYHSAKSARDRDRLRQEVLENLGWKIRRIWSTDWFKNPEAAIQPILHELHILAADISEVNIDEKSLNDRPLQSKPLLEVGEEYQVRNFNEISSSVNKEKKGGQKREVEQENAKNSPIEPHTPLDWSGELDPDSFRTYLGKRECNDIWEGLLHFKDYLDLLYPEVRGGAHLLSPHRFEYFAQEMPIALDELEDGVCAGVAPLHQEHYDEFFEYIKVYALL